MGMVSEICVEDFESAFRQIRPLILGHGGDIEVENISPEGVVSVRLLGACKSCPNMAMTYVGPIRTFLMEVEGVTEVKCRQVKASAKTLSRMAKLMGARPIETWVPARQSTQIRP